MVISNLVVPGYVKYISDWKEYSLRNYQFKHILNKQVPGCGYTEYCLTNNLPMIICSPRKMLIKNKMDQHNKDVFFFYNGFVDELLVDENINKEKLEENEFILYQKEKKEDDSNDKTYADKLGEMIKSMEEYVESVKIPKIMITYDSFHYVIDVLKRKNIIDKFYIVIDEFQSIFIDSRFKSTIELNFVEDIKDLNKVCFVSATPMIQKYLEKIDEFKDLPYYELDWISENPLRIIKPNLKVRVIKSLTAVAREIIHKYLSNEFESYTYTDEYGAKKIKYSTEAVFFVNSVFNIISIIKGNKLKPEECNILCANSSENEKKIRKKLGRKFNIGSIPLLGEPHKMFTFCTRTVYLGADFYSTNARTFILSDANIDCMAVDITLDLPQILGRQRLSENPWRNRAELYCKLIGTNVDKSRFDKHLNTKIERTNTILEMYHTSDNDNYKQTMEDTYIRDMKQFRYKDDYVATNKLNKLVFNKFTLISEQRAFDIQQIDYKDRFTIFNVINNSTSIICLQKTNDFIEEFKKQKTGYNQIKLLCNNNLTDAELSYVLNYLPLKFKTMCDTYGLKLCKDMGYNITWIEREYKFRHMKDIEIRTEMRDRFVLNERYTLEYIKTNIQEIYDMFGIKKKAKATDINDYYETKKCTINFPDKSRCNGFILLKRCREIDVYEKERGRYMKLPPKKEDFLPLRIEQKNNVIEKK